MLSPARRSVVLSMIGGMMAASYLDSEGMVDLSYGFPRGGFAEGTLVTITGALADYVVLLAFRKLREKFSGILGGVGGGGGASAGASAGLFITVLVIVAVAWGLMGFYTVDQQERGVVLRLGKYQETVQQIGRAHV